MSELLTPNEVARLFHRVDVKTVTRWASEGRLEGFKTPGGRWRFRAEVIAAALESAGTPHEDRWLSYDADADASYLTVRGDISLEPAARTVEVGDPNDLHVDLDADGRILGVERYAGRLTLDDLVEVLARCRWEVPR